MSSRWPFVLALAAVSTASTCDSNVGDGDSRSRETIRVSQRADGREASQDCVNADVSADGRYVVFESASEDLVDPDGNGYRDIFLKDRGTGELHNVTRVSPAIFLTDNLQLTSLLGDAFSPRVSADGRYVAFLSAGAFAGPLALIVKQRSAAALTVFVLDRRTGRFREVLDRNILPWPDRSCSNLSMSDDGRFVCFQTAASNLGYANPSFLEQVYAADLSVDPPAFVLVSRAASSAATIANDSVSDARMSRDGSAVTFMSSASNLNAGGVDHVFLGTPAGAAPQMVTVMPGTSTPAPGSYLYPCVSGNGRYVAFYAFFTTLPVLQSGLVRVDRGIPGEVPPSVVQFATDMYTSPLQVPSGAAFSIADDGTLAYQSHTNPGQIHVRRAPDAVEVASVSSLGVRADLPCLRPWISGDGRWVVWDSAAGNLVEGDRNLKRDVFVRGPLR
jgi:Tol biopolymer transport system component